MSLLRSYTILSSNTVFSLIWIVFKQSQFCYKILLFCVTRLVETFNLKLRHVYWCFFFLLTPIGGQSLCKALLENATLEHLILASNEMSEPTAAAMAQVAIHNSTLRKVNLSCNTLGQVSYKQAELVLVNQYSVEWICHVSNEPCRYQIFTDCNRQYSWTNLGWFWYIKKMLCPNLVKSLETASLNHEVY